MGWNTFSTVCGLPGDPFTGEHYPALLIIKKPLVWSAIEYVAEWVCELLGHRFCNHWPMFNLLTIGLGREETFEISVPNETLARYATWRGWEYWGFSDEEELDEFLSD